MKHFAWVLALIACLVFVGFLLHGGYATLDQLFGWLLFFLLGLGIFALL